MARLDYDDSASIYVGIALGTVFLLPFTLGLMYSVISTMMGSSVKHDEGRTAAERRKLKKLSQERGLKTMLTRSFYIKVGILLAGWLFVFYLYSLSGSHAQIQQFNPFEILGLDESATNKQIKKAYRKLSLSHHPDKTLKLSPDERAYRTMLFEKIQKAHEVLTDENARALFEKTGSPDGSSSMEVSIGLPKFLSDKKNHNLILLVYLFVLIVTVPISVWRWYDNSKKYGDKLVLNDSYGIFAFLLADKKMKLEYLPQVFALAAEFRQLPSYHERTEAETKCLEKIRSSLVSEGRMAPAPFQLIKDQKFFKRWPACATAEVLIHAHLNRRAGELTPLLRKDLDFMLHKSTILVDAMVDTVLLNRNTGRIKSMYLFEQYLTQALWVPDSQLLQLPHITPAEAELVKTPGIKQFLASKDKTGLDNLPAEKIMEIEAVEKLLPNIDVKVTLGVISNELPDGTLEFEENACMGDVMTAYVEIERKHFPVASETMDPVHAPFLPVYKEEEWYVLFTKKNDVNVIIPATLRGDGRVLREKLQFPSQMFLKPGVDFTFDFHVFSNSYVGFDVKKSETCRVLKEGSVAPAELHPEDKALENEPTLFEEAFGKAEVSDDSDFKDSDDEGEEQKVRQRKNVANKKKDELVASDSDDETDADMDNSKKKK